jgi:hypothetical protein
VTEDVMRNTYNLPTPPPWEWATDIDDKTVLKYSGNFFPRIGARVTVYMNGMGNGTVEAYFTEHGFLGLQVRLDRDRYRVVYVYGIDVDPLIDRK